MWGGLFRTLECAQLESPTLVLRTGCMRKSITGQSDLHDALVFLVKKVTTVQN